jgi:protein TonB
MVREEKKVVKESCLVVQLSQVCEVLPSPTTKKVSPLKKVKPVKKKKRVVKKVDKKPLKKKVAPKKVVSVKKTPAVEPVMEKSEIVEEEVVEPEPKEVVVTPTEPAKLSPAAVEKVEAPVTPESTPEDIYIKAHISEIMALLRKNLYYPRMARKRHMEGKVVVRFELMKDGSIKNIVIVEAERELLGRAAVTTIERLEGKFPTSSEVLLLNVPIMYKLK